MGITIILELVGIRTTEDLHEYLMEVFRFPDYYGHNWDAFWDCLRDVEEDLDEIILRGWLEFMEALPRDADLLLECLEDYRREFRQELDIKMR